MAGGAGRNTQTLYIMKHVGPLALTL